MINYEILENIEYTSSTNEKKEKFRRFCERQENVDFIRLAFNNIEYNIAKRIMDEVIEEVKAIDNTWFGQTLSDEEAITEVNKLPNYSGNDLKKKLIGLFSNLEGQQIKWFSRAILHNLEMGFDVKLVNSVLEEMGLEKVHYFEQPQLCGVLKVVQGEIQFPEGFPRNVFVEEKFDGVRALIEKKDGKITITSRNGKPYNNFKSIEDALLKLNFEDFIFDCEIMVESEESAVENYQKLTTVLQRKEMQNVDVDVVCNIFDVLKLDGVDLTGKTQFDRRVVLDAIFFDRPLQRVEALRVLNRPDRKKMIHRFYNEIIEKNGEGIILKIAERPYEFESRTNWWKVKPIIDGTFKVVGYGFGEGKSNKELVGYLEIQVGEIINRVGSGITDEMAEYMTKNKDNLIGRKVDVQYTGFTKDNHLRFPRFIRFRDEL